jgi:hypothetical protein
LLVILDGIKLLMPTSTSQTSYTKQQQVLKVAACMRERFNPLIASIASTRTIFSL